MLTLPLPLTLTLPLTPGALRARVALPRHRRGHGISVYLRVSPYITLYLPISSCISHGTDEDTVPKICHRWVPPLTPTLALVIAISLNLTLTLTLTRTLTLTLNLTLTLTLNFILTLTRTLTRCPRSARWASTARSAVS